MANGSLPDNLLSRLGRVSVTERSFKNDAGDTIKYSRLILVGEIKGEQFEIETKIEQKDVKFLQFADVVNEDFEN